jgi:LPXTG-motif cell wall-anchored protein
LSSRRRGLAWSLTAIITTSLVVLGPGVAVADERGPVRDFVGGVKNQFEKSGEEESEEAPEAPAGVETTADQRATSQEAGDSEEPGTKAKSQVVEVDLGGEDVVDLGRSEASIDDSDRSRGNATLLALGGQEIIGTQADSDGEGETHAGDPLAALCDGSEGQLCLRVLFADAYADETADRSEASSQTGVANVCLGGDSSDQRAECTGPVGAKVAASKAQTERGKSDGRTSGRSESAVVDVCVGPENDTCAVGAEVLKAESEASSDGTTHGESTVAGLELGNEEVLSLDEQGELEIQPDCAEPSVVCAVANEGEAVVTEGAVRQTQDALNAGILPDTLDVDLGISRTEVTVRAGEPAAAGQSPSAGGPGTPDAGDPGEAGGILPNTGGFWSGLLAIALGAVSAGAFLIARNRRLGTLA